MSYEPRGKMVDLVAALRAEPERAFTGQEVAAILCCKNYPSTIDQYVYAACAGGIVFKREVDRVRYYAGAPVSDLLLQKAGISVQPRNGDGRPIPAGKRTAEEVEAALADVRCPKVEPGWTPPKMVAPRAGSDNIEAQLRAISEAAQDELGKRTTSAATAESHGIPDVASTPEQAGTAGPEQERPTVANEGVAREASGGCAQTDEEEEVEFNAARWMDGDVVIYGAQANEDGSFTLNAEQVKRLVGFIYGQDFVE